MRKHRKEEIQRINDSKQLIINWVNYVGYLDKQEFAHLLSNLGINNDPTFTDRLFWLFDLSSKNVV